MRGLHTNLLGLSALNLAMRVDATTYIASNIQEFAHLGNSGKEYEIKLKPNAKLHNLFTLPLPLHEKVRQGLDRMESLGVILHVGEPTMWCTGMIVVL